MPPGVDWLLGQAPVQGAELAGASGGALGSNPSLERRTEDLLEYQSACRRDVFWETH